MGEHPFQPVRPLQQGISINKLFWRDAIYIGGKGLVAWKI